MTAPPRLRKLVLFTHVATSVGWLGTVVAYLALDVTTVVSEDENLVGALYAAMEIVVYAAIVPLALASVLVGILNALITPWGLFRHYWVVVKLLLTLVATSVLLIETSTISYLARQAAAIADPRPLPGTLPHSIGGLIVLLGVLVLSIYKPRGLTRYGWRKQRAAR
ncbi:MAG: DUF2269 domain-containing protein [Actinophytocola sp.]|nr:DUF2269 domain-containing protein [Actinophytocola sp.]